MSNDTRGVFTLIDIPDLALSEEWVNLDDVWLLLGVLPPNTGYFGGGSPGTISRMDKVNYSSDTTAAVPGANLTPARGGLAATGNSTDGYFGGGYSPSVVTTMEKLTYSSDTISAIASAVLSLGRSRVSATGNADAGYFGGGSPLTSLMDKLTYSTDTTVATPSANLTVARSGVFATGNLTAGYFGGGSLLPGSPGSVTRMDKLTYSTDTTAFTPSANLSSSRYGAGATGNIDAGYFGGGRPAVSAAPNSTMDKVTYSSDTRSTVPGANLSASRYLLAATGNSSSSGYFGGGSLYPSSPTYVSRMDKLTYSTDTTTFTPGANLSISRSLLAASSAEANVVFSPSVRFSDGKQGYPPDPTPTSETSLELAEIPVPRHGILWWWG